MDMLARMPLHFVRRLREIRMKQVEEANRQQEQQMKQVSSKTDNIRMPYNPAAAAMFNGASLDDIIDELT